MVLIGEAMVEMTFSTQWHDTDTPRAVLFRPVDMTEREFNSLRSMIYDYCGIEIKEHKKHLLINRLAKRLRHLGLPSFSDYLIYLGQGNTRHQEFIELIDAVTTNKTDFFREPKHFTFLQDRVVPEFLHSRERLTEPFRVWSAACSSGEEPYTIAICLSELFSGCPGSRFIIAASDISETVLRNAVTGIYDESRVEPIPMPLLRKYFLKGNQRYKIKPETAQNVNFLKLNLQHDFHRSMNGFHVIFLRNVLIYFNPPTQREIIRKCWYALRPGGYLFLGHSESLSGSKSEYEYIAPAIYRKSPLAE